MGYLTTLAIVFVSIWCCFFLLLFHYGVFALIGVFKRTTYPKTDRLLKYGIVIAARNEEAVIGSLLDSIRAVVREELHRVEFVSVKEKNEQPQAGDVDENVLGFLLALQQEEGDTTDPLF